MNNQQRTDTVVFIYPKLKNRHSDCIYAPHAFLFIAASLEKHGYKPELIDVRINGVDYVTLVKEAVEKKPAFIGISSLTGFQVKHGIEIVELIKRADSNTPVVWGGIHSSLFPEHILDHSKTDIVVMGEGEETVIALANYLTGKSDVRLGEINGIAFRDDESIHQVAPRTMIDMEKLPIPAWHLIKDQLPNYISDGAIHLMTSRGCPFKCNFCYNTTFNKRRWRKRDTNRVLQEVDWLVTNSPVKFHKILFTDDNFFTNKDRALEICAEVAKRNLKMHVDIRIHMITEELMEEIFRYGVHDFYFGIESGSDNVLKLMDKGISVQDTVNAVNILKKYPVKAVFSCILSFPGEEIKDVKQTLSLASFIYKAITNFNMDQNSAILMNIFRAYPGTEHFNKHKEKLDLADPETINWNTGANNEFVSDRKFIECICTLFRFLNEKNIFHRYQFAKALVVFLLNKSAHLRVKHGLFRFPIEFMLMNSIIQRFRIL